MWNQATETMQSGVHDGCAAAAAQPRPTAQPTLPKLELAASLMYLIVLPGGSKEGGALQPHRALPWPRITTCEGSTGAVAAHRA